jgi:hypothetical protein
MQIRKTAAPPIQNFTLELVACQNQSDYAVNSQIKLFSPSIVLPVSFLSGGAWIAAHISLPPSPLPQPNNLTQRSRSLLAQINNSPLTSQSHPPSWYVVALKSVSQY